MPTDSRPTLNSILALVEEFDDPCECKVFRNGVFIGSEEFDLYSDYIVEGLTVRSGFPGEPPYLAIYLL